MKLLITGALKKDEEFFKKLEDYGYEISYISDERIPLQEQNIDPEVFDGVICNSLFLYTPIELFANLRFIQLTSAGLDRVPLEYVRTKNIKLYNASGVYSVPMAEFAVCGVLQLYKQSRFFCENQKQRLWQKHRGLQELSGKSVIIVGCGSVGLECAKRFEAFGCDVTGVDVREINCKYFQKTVFIDLLNDVIPHADIVILTVALTNETYHLFGKQQFSLMKDGAVLVNISRGGIVDTEALTDMVSRLGGAVLDVFEEEPLSKTSPLWNFENVIVTPHNSFVGDNNRGRLMSLILQNLC